MVLLMIFALIGRTGGYGISFALFLLMGVAVLTMVQRGMQAVSARPWWRCATPQRPAPLGPFIDPLAALRLHLASRALVYTLGLAAVIGAWQHVDWVPADADDGARGAGARGAVRPRPRAHPRLGRAVRRRWSRASLNLAARSLIFVSGVFYMPVYLPPFLRDWLAWNPVLQAVELLRRGFYGPDYPALLDPRYLVLAVLSTLALGVALVWSARAAPDAGLRRPGRAATAPRRRHPHRRLCAHTKTPGASGHRVSGLFRAPATGASGLSC